MCGRNPCLPKDVLLGLKNDSIDVEVPNEYLKELKCKLKDIIFHVKNNLQIHQAKMKNNYDKKATEYHDYDEGDKVWLKKKCYRTGENKKLSPRKTGPWVIIKKYDNLVNFKIQMGKEEKVVHYNRIVPVKGLFVNGTNRSNNKDKALKTHESPYSVPESSESGESEMEFDTESEPEIGIDADIPVRRYPERQRAHRQIQGGSTLGSSWQ